MALNIKNERAVALARELAELTGESLTDAVRIAIEERRARLLHLQDREVRLARARAVSDDLATGLGRYRDGLTTDDLYDPDTGLPA
ncbi:MAG: type II toxin-antitoxin system VapB family antitoxin [Thermoleophilia bacterium]|nr:type II toxin-antitoxin system VapB family antitoxin [Thermoleophilia bacterium]